MLVNNNKSNNNMELIHDTVLHHIYSNYAQFGHVVQWESINRRQALREVGKKEFNTDP